MPISYVSLRNMKHLTIQNIRNSFLSLKMFDFSKNESQCNLYTYKSEIQN